MQRKTSQINRLKAFTLLELLIAASIFAIIMLLIVGILARTSLYQSKISAMRSVSEETRRLADQITRDVRAANGLVTIKVNSTDTAPFPTYKNGIALFDCTSPTPPTSPTCSRKDYSTPFSTSTGFFADPTIINANTLVLVSNGQYQIYRYYIRSGITSKIYYKTGAVVNPLTLGGAGGIVEGLSEVISNNETIINFAGFGPVDATTTVRQPYVEFYITSQTLGYAPANPGSGYKTELRSMVTGRSYN